MDSKQLIIITAATTLMAFSYTVAAKDDEAQQVNNGYPDYRIQLSNVHFAIRDNDKNQGRHNSNRLSDPDSTRGQARAEGRRGNKDNPKNDAPWYDPRLWFE